MAGEPPNLLAAFIRPILSRTDAVVTSLWSYFTMTKVLIKTFTNYIPYIASLTLQKKTYNLPFSWCVPYLLSGFFSKLFSSDLNVPCFLKYISSSSTKLGTAHMTLSRRATWATNVHWVSRPSCARPHPLCFRPAEDGAQSSCSQELLAQVRKFGCRLSHLFPLHSWPTAHI